MKKAGIINRIHKGLRTWLFEAGIKIQQTDFLQVQEGKETIELLRKVLQVTNRKTAIDEKTVFPVLVTHSPFFVSLLDEENQKVRMIGNKLCSYLHNYIQPGTSGHYSAAGFSIQQGFIEFISAVLNYMNRIELMLQELYTSDVTGGFLKKLENAMLVQVNESNVIIDREWMLKGLSDRELEELLSKESIIGNGWLKMELMDLSNRRSVPQRRERMETTKLRMAAA